jgi:molybdate transport system regulatory protein
MGGIQMKLRTSQLLLNDEGKIIMGSGRMAIFESLQHTGSINQTARELNMAYKTVWSKIKATEKNWGRPVVITDRKTGTRLTREGVDLLEKYRKLKKDCIHADDCIFQSIFQIRNNETS